MKSPKFRSPAMGLIIRLYMIFLTVNVLAHPASATDDENTQKDLLTIFGEPAKYTVVQNEGNVGEALNPKTEKRFYTLNRKQQVVRNKRPSVQNGRRRSMLFVLFPKIRSVASMIVNSIKNRNAGKKKEIAEKLLFEQDTRNVIEEAQISLKIASLQLTEMNNQMDVLICCLNKEHFLLQKCVNVDCTLVIDERNEATIDGDIKKQVEDSRRHLTNPGTKFNLHQQTASSYSSENNSRDGIASYLFIDQDYQDNEI